MKDWLLKTNFSWPAIIGRILVNCIFIAIFIYIYTKIGLAIFPAYAAWCFFIGWIFRTIKEVKYGFHH